MRMRDSFFDDSLELHHDFAFFMVIQPTGSIYSLIAPSLLLCHLGRSVVQPYRVVHQGTVGYADSVVLDHLMFHWHLNLIWLFCEESTLPPSSFPCWVSLCLVPAFYTQCGHCPSAALAALSTDPYGYKREELWGLAGVQG